MFLIEAGNAIIDCV